MCKGSQQDAGEQGQVSTGDVGTEAKLRLVQLTLGLHLPTRPLSVSELATLSVLAAAALNCVLDGADTAKVAIWTDGVQQRDVEEKREDK